MFITSKIKIVNSKKKKCKFKSDNRWHISQNNNSFLIVFIRLSNQLYLSQYYHHVYHLAKLFIH